MAHRSSSVCLSRLFRLRRQFRLPLSAPFPLAGASWQAVALVGLLGANGCARRGARGYRRSSAQRLGHFVSATALCSGRAPAGFPLGAVARGLPPWGSVRLPDGFRPYLSATAQKIHDLITLTAVRERGLSAPLALPPSVFHGFDLAQACAIFTLIRRFTPIPSPQACACQSTGAIAHWQKNRALTGSI